MNFKLCVCMFWNLQFKTGKGKEGGNVVGQYFFAQWAIQSSRHQVRTEQSNCQNQENSWIASNPFAQGTAALKSTILIAIEFEKEEQCWKAGWNSHRLSKQHTTLSDTQNWKDIACWPGLHAPKKHTTSALLFQLKKLHYRILVSQPVLSIQVEHLRAAGI